MQCYTQSCEWSGEVIDSLYPSFPEGLYAHVTLAVETPLRLDGQGRSFYTLKGRINFMIQAVKVANRDTLV